MQSTAQGLRFAPDRDPDLARFRAVQQLAYQCCEAVSAQLQAGMTEKDAAELLRAWLHDKGVRDWLHKPFAWFGDRTAFQGFSGLSHMAGFNMAFFPSSRKLERDMPVILDVAPVLDGFLADVGYACCLGHNPVLDRLMDDLAEHRQLILDQIRQRRTMAEVAQSVDALCARQGVEPRHKAYPFKVLAHRVTRLNNPKGQLNIARFGLNSTLDLVKQVGQGRQEGWSPLWSIDKRSAHPPQPGLWAVEPHLGRGGVGAKFEELLVITEHDAFWLDDDLPHVRRWRERQVPAAA